ncbi:hypothetical protein [Streptomyces nanshensis]|nr:hypothetical protein [Streptomyces nanshensis]
MPTTCPRCGTRSSAASESCGECGHGLYRVSYQHAPAPPRFTLHALAAIPMAARLTVSVAVLVVGTGVLTGLVVGGDKDEDQMAKRPPVTTVPREPLPTATSSSPEPSKTKAPPKPAPAATTPPPSTHPPKPSPSKTSAPPIPGIKEAQWAIELAEELQKKYGTPSPSDGSQWDDQDQDYQYEESYQEGDYDQSG